ncbi:MAG: alginate export family protein, partial [Myxococcales bacterium]|nr:alginate export family protein [Myxococcales bacterium]
MRRWLLLLFWLLPALPGQANEPLRLQRAPAGEDGIDVIVTQRTRYERLWQQFRAGAVGADHALAMRTGVAAEARFAPLAIGLEVVDARQYLADGTPPVDTSQVNPLDVLQAYVGLTVADAFMDKDTARLRAGRMTLDLGGRRLIARNRFRNTINSFTGIDAQWQSPAGDAIRAFGVVPVGRRPDDPDALRDNALAFDHEQFGTFLLGVSAAAR